MRLIGLTYIVLWLYLRHSLASFHHSSASKYFNNGSSTNHKHPIIIAEAKLSQKDEPRGVMDVIAEKKMFHLNIELEKNRHSHQGALGEHQAEAEIQEAKQRKQQAFMETLKAQTVFNAEKGQYNLGYVGRGYDILRGHPMSPDGTVDPGFRLPVIELPYTWRHTADGEYRVPDNVDVIAEPSAKFVASTTLIRNEESYHEMLRKEVQVKASLDLKSANGDSNSKFGAEFSGNEAYQRDTRELRESENSYMDVTGRTTAYRARISRTSDRSLVTAEFETALNRISGHTCSYQDESGLQQYMNILDEYGTHYVTEVVMGARAVQRRLLTRKSATKLQKIMIEHGVRGGLNGEYGSVKLNASGGYNYGANRNESSEKQRKSEEMVDKMREFYVGGSAPDGKLENGSTESLREWARSAQGNPAPIQYSVAPIDELLMRDGYFRKPDKFLSTKRQCLQMALQRWCLEMAENPNMCVSKQKRNADRNRRKRSVGSRPVRYGDLVTIRSGSGHVLELSRQPTLVGAQGYCYKLKSRKSRETTEHYERFFEILPPASVPGSMGKPLLQGDRFRLNTKRGVDLYLAPTLSLNKASWFNKQPRDINRIKEDGHVLCVPATGPGRVSYVFGLSQSVPCENVTITLKGEQSRTSINSCTGQLNRTNPTAFHNIEDVGPITHVYLSKSSHFAIICPVTLDVVNVQRGRQYTFSCICDDNDRKILSCIRPKESYNPFSDTVLSEFSSYPVELSFDVPTAGGDIITGADDHVITVHSGRSVTAMYWGYLAPDVLMVSDGKVDVRTIHLEKNNTDDIKWKITPERYEISSNPVINLVPKKIPQAQFSNDPPVRRSLSVLFPEKMVVCSDDESEFRKAFMKLLINPDASFTNLTIQKTHNDTFTTVTITFDVIFYTDPGKADVLVNRLRERVIKNPYLLPCTVPMYQHNGRQKNRNRRNTPRQDTLVTGLVVFFVLLALGIVGLVYHFRFRKGRQYKVYNRGSSEYSWDNYSEEYVTPRDYVNAYVGLRQMMSQLARMSQYYDTCSPTHARCDDFCEQTNRRHQSGAPYGDADDSTATTGDHPSTHGSSQTVDSGSRDGPRDDARESKHRHTMDHLPRVFLRRPSSRRRRKLSVKDNFKRLTRCLTGEEEDLPNVKRDVKNNITSPQEERQSGKTDSFLAKESNKNKDALFRSSFQFESLLDPLEKCNKLKGDMNTVSSSQDRFDEKREDGNTSPSLSRSIACMLSQSKFEPTGMHATEGILGNPPLSTVSEVSVDIQGNDTPPADAPLPPKPPLLAKKSIPGQKGAVKHRPPPPPCGGPNENSLSSGPGPVPVVVCLDRDGTTKTIVPITK